MDVSGSFIELACVRLGIVPAGTAISDHRFAQLARHISCLREIPLTKLPRRGVSSRAHSTFSGSSSAFRSELTFENATKLLRSNSLTRNIGAQFKQSAIAPAKSDTSASTAASASAPNLSDSSDGCSTSSSPLPPDAKQSSQEIVNPETIAGPGNPPSLPTESPIPPKQFSRVRDFPLVSRPETELKLSGADINATFRMRYQVFHRGRSGALVPSALSEWDDFYSNGIRGVIGIADISSSEGKEEEISNACKDFKQSIARFRDASVFRLLIFTNPSDDYLKEPFNAEDKYSTPGGKALSRFSIGFVPEKSEPRGTHLEVRAHVEYFAGLALHALDKQCWKRQESSDAPILSPLDEKQTMDRQPKLAKRRGGRLDKLIADSLLQMGSPREALGRYNSAMERAKASGDRLWLAGATEGWVAAHVLCHVGSGGKLNESHLLDRVSESYAEVYKLYQKKRCPEPEAAAAMRLAYFLGIWTNRRKDALIAAEHAATVGESLKSPKRAALWEALAQLSERMGCRRKASFFLYRLGDLQSSLSHWSSAVELLIASEAQLRTNARKTWPNLNRQLLLDAARYAAESGDSKTSSKLYAEALTCGHDPQSQSISDSDIIAALRSIQVPVHLPAAKSVVTLNQIAPLNVMGILPNGSLDTEPLRDNEREHDGPFIYNPFAAGKRALQKQSADAVTWISGEKAQVRVAFQVGVSGNLKIDIISLIVCTDEDDRDLMQPSSVEDIYDEDGDQATRIHEELQKSSSIAKTIPETVTVRGKHDLLEKLVTVIPRKEGKLYIKGILLRLFDGALVLLRISDVIGMHEEVCYVNVIQELPRVRMDCRAEKSVIGDTVSSYQPIIVHHGEKQRMGIRITNIGKETIRWSKVERTESPSQFLNVTMEPDDEESLLESIKKPRGSHTIGVLIEGLSGSFLTPDRLLPLDRSETVTIRVLYMGEGPNQLKRESCFTFRVFSRAAVSLGPILVFRKATQSCGIGVEVLNCSSVPASVELEVIDDEADEKKSAQRTENEKDLVESGASVRVLRQVSCTHHSMNKKCKGGIQARLRWKLMALGREGVIEMNSDENLPVLGNSQELDHIQNTTDLENRVAKFPITLPLKVDVNDLLDVRKSELGGTVPKRMHQVQCGSFWEIVISIRSSCVDSLPRGTLLDIGLQHDGDSSHPPSSQWSCMVGATKRIQVGGLLPNGDGFEHRIGGRVVSKGRVALHAQLYHYNSTGSCSAELREVSSLDIIQPATIDSFDAVGEHDGRVILARRMMYLNSC